MGLPNPSRETKFSGTNADREILISPVQLTTCRTGNLTRLIQTLAICVTIQCRRVEKAQRLRVHTNHRSPSGDTNKHRQTYITGAEGFGGKALTEGSLSK